MWNRAKHCKRTKKTEIAAVSSEEVPQAPVEAEVTIPDRVKSVMNILDINAQAALDLLPAELETEYFEGYPATDAYAQRLVAFTKAIRNARQALLKPTSAEIQTIFQAMVHRNQWQLASQHTIFSLATRKRVGSKYECFEHYGLQELETVSVFLARYLRGNQSLLRSIVDALLIPIVTIDMAKIALLSDSYSLDMMDEDTDEFSVATPRTADLYMRGPRIPQSTLRPDLLVLFGYLLVPPCARRTCKWKSLVVASGSRDKPHVVDKFCSDLVDLGMTTCASDLGTKRTHPYMWYISDWNASYVPIVKAKLNAGFVVVIRSDLTVPADVCNDNELRLNTVHVNGMAGAVTDSDWAMERESVLLDAFEAYQAFVSTQQDAAPPRVPFVNPVDMIPYRPVPRAAVPSSLFSEMLHGFVGVCISNGHEAALEDIETVYASYAKRRGFLELSISTDAVLQGAAMLQNTVDDIVRYCPVNKTFSNLYIIH